MTNPLHNLHDRQGVEALFEAFGELLKQTAKAAEEKKARRKEQRNTKARARYAVRKQAGTLPSRKAVTAMHEPEYALTSCQCAVCGCPPCSWCTDPARTEDDFS
jgi:hypothetical protein